MNNVFKEGELERNSVVAKLLEAALTPIRKAAASPDLIADTGRGLVEIVSGFTQTFLWLQRYDEGLLQEMAGQQGGG